MSRFIRVHHRVITTVGIQIESVDGIRFEIVDGVSVEETTGFGVVEAGFEVVEAGVYVVVIRAITEGVDVADMGHIGNFCTVCTKDFALAPRVVAIFYHNGIHVVKEEGDVKRKTDFLIGFP